MAQLPQMLATDPHLADVTYHAYPLNCFAKPGSLAYPTISDLLSLNSSVGLADNVAQFATEARAAGRQFRVDELNTSACGGSSGVSNTFASALWATDTLFAMASKGVSGVNIQDFNGSRYKPFGFSLVNGKWVGTVYPLYYGLSLFSKAAPAGSKLLAVTTSGTNAVRAWAAQTPGSAGSTATGPETVTLINDHTERAETVAVKVTGATTGSLLRMRAPSVSATTGVTLAGQSYGASTTTGLITGPSATETLAPGKNGTYEISLPPASAALLTLTRR